ncbi:TonB-dependent receptor domain-containing protein [Chromobacterium sp. IIBBL 290-4]|uniref:TonB-dependent receptor domain-containing protein n=1 Tax=Chromobacterium sp. IIBBL 290-4 TaxID=2953890 RepID=UPI0020B6EF44|nr:TonB-dependent receptor [Chromobacterium sp. IIBBL 290-4]UTH76696.1 TonB-dependent receptor [Chromobacterium sp. IIBBL 290-4]
MLCIKSILPLSGALALGAVLQPALAAEAPSELERVVVTATGYEQKIKEAPASISVITREELEKQPFTNLADAIRNLEGVSVNGSGPADKDISIRGLPGEYTLIMVDGRRQNTREARSRGTGGFQQYQIPPLEAIERIEVVRGPMSSLYGSDAMGGVINIITRKSLKEWHGAMTLGGTITEHANEGDTGQSSFWVGGPLQQDLLSLQLYGALNNQAEDSIYFPKSRDGGKDAVHVGDINAKLSLTPNAGNEITLEAGHNTLRKTTTPGKSLAAGSDKYDQLDTRDHWSLSHSGKYGALRSSVALYQEIDKSSSDTNGVNDGKDLKITNSTLDAQLSILLDRHTLKLGSQIGQQVGSSLQAQEAFDPSRFKYRGAANPDKVTINTWALFGEDTYDITDSLKLTGGGRVDHHSIFGTHFTPRVYLVEQLTPQWTLKGGFGKGFKAPTIRQGAAGFCMRTGKQIEVGLLCGDPNLKPEESTSYEASAHFDDNKGLSANATLFYNQFKNKVVSYGTDQFSNQLVSKGKPSRVYVYGNVDAVNIHGLELSGNWAFAPSWSLSGNYTYTKSKRHGGKDTTFSGQSLEGMPLDKTPEHSGNVKLDWTPMEKLGLYTRLNFEGKQYYTGFRNGAYGVRTRGGSSTFDLGGSYKLSKHFDLNFAVLNVGDRSVAIDDRVGNSVPNVVGPLNGNWMVDEGRRYWLTLSGKF